MKTLGNLAGEQQLVDLLISNFVYEKDGAKHKKLCSTEVHFRKIKYLHGMT